MKKLLCLVLAIATCLALCVPAMAEDKPVTLKLIASQPEYQAVEEEIWKLYTEEHPNVTIEMTSINEDTTAAFKTQVAAGDAPDVCVTYSYPTIQTYADMGGIINLNDIGGKKLEEYKDVLQVEELNRTTLVHLVEKIFVYDDKRVHVVLRNQNQFIKVAMLCDFLKQSETERTVG